mgnify:CR=1 FL=1
MKIDKKLLIYALCVILSVVSVSCVYAADEMTLETADIIVLNDEIILREGEDYDNPETGEYFHWGNERGLDKSFSFLIQNSVTSSSFVLNGTRALIQVDAVVVDLDENVVSGYSGHIYSVELIGTGGSTIQFAVGTSGSAAMSGLRNGRSYKVRIINNDALPATRYLKGSGTITSY